MEPIAIVGFSFKMPQGIIDETSLWETLEHQKSVMTEWPQDRLTIDSFHDDGSKKLNMIAARGAHFITEDLGAFDAPFFSITAKEAAALDPQQRWALETAYHAFENAGMTMENLHGSRTAVIVGCMADDYSRIILKDADTMPRQTVVGNASTMLPNRVSRHFNLHGPSIHVDTACSSSMTALDMACQSLRSGDATAALVIGVNLMISPDVSMFLSNMNFLSPDGKCFSFDARANGYARGEGVAALVLKPLQDALRDGDIIRAVVRATASNQDGRSIGLGQPSAEAQEALIRHVYNKAGLSFEKTRYVEAHGTGTPIGDPVEMTAIGKVFGTHRSPKEPLFVGSIKANIGHLEGASALAGVIKSIAVLERGIIPPNALFEKMNPKIDAGLFHLEVPTQKTVWPTPGLRRVSVNSFGFGGANSHVVLDDAFHYLRSRGLDGYHHTNPIAAVPINGSANGTIERCEEDDSEAGATANSSYAGRAAPKLLVWTAVDSNALQRIFHSYKSYALDIKGNPTKLAQLAYTLAARRSMMAWRAFIISDGTHIPFNEKGLQKAVSESPCRPLNSFIRASTDGVGIAFVFTGQGAQYVEMGLDLVQRYPVFAESLRQSDKVLASLGCHWTIFDELCNENRIHRPELSQPLCTALQIALVDLLRSLGVLPVSVVGHSSGEIAAAYTVGALSHESACKIAYFRGKFAGKLVDENEATGKGGAMMSVNLAASKVPEWLIKLSPELREDAVHIACFNSPTNVTLSGSTEPINALKLLLDEEGIFAHKLSTGIAYHSPAMHAIAVEYLVSMGSLEAGLRKHDIQEATMISSVTGNIVSRKLLTSPQYWVDNLTSPVRFSDALQHLMGDTTQMDNPLSTNVVTDLVEIGPHGALRRPVKDILFGLSPSTRYHSILDRTKGPVWTTLSLLGELFCHGHPVSILEANGQAAGKMPFLIDCPSYPFDHSKRYWAESRLSRDFRLRRDSPNYLLGKRSHDWNVLQPRWRNWLYTETTPWLSDHIVSDTVLCPGTGLVVMAIEAVQQAAATSGRIISGFFIKEARFLAPVIVGETTQNATETELHLQPVQTQEKESTWSEIRIFSHYEDRWTECFNAHIQVQYERAATVPVPVDHGREQQWEEVRIRNQVEQAYASCKKVISTREFYKFCTNHGIRYGESFQLLRDVAWDAHNTSVARIDLTSTGLRHASTNSPVHPAILDAALHLPFAQISQGLSQPMPAMVPYKASNVWISAKVWHKTTPTVQLNSTLRSDTESGSSRIEGACNVLAEDGAPLCIIESLVFSGVSDASIVGNNEAANRDLLYNIAWKPQLSSLASSQLQQICDSNVQAADETPMIRIRRKIESTMGIAVHKALQRVTATDIDNRAPYFLKYIAFLKQLCNTEGHPSEIEAISDAALRSLLAECEEEQPEYRLLPAVARALPSILRGETDPLELLFSSELAKDFYVHLYSLHMRDTRFQTFLDLATHENPSMRILEIGSGTGGFTRPVLATLRRFEQETGQMRFAEYFYTDISPAFFENAQIEFLDYQERMTYKTLDIERIPFEQGFEAGTYDMVIAGSVLHATPHLASTLKNVRTLLKPGGLFVFQEVTRPDNISVNVGFGCLEGWWLSGEEWRQSSPLITEDKWDQLLQENDLFSGAELTLRDYPSDECHFSSIIVSRAVDGTTNDATLESNSDNRNPLNLTILIKSELEVQRALAMDISKLYPTIQVKHLNDFLEGKWTATTDECVISLVEVGRPYLEVLSKREFEGLQSLVRGISSMLWVTSLPSTDRLAVDPHCALATGFLRGLRSEDNSKHLISLIIESECPPEGAAHYVTTLIQSCLANRAAMTTEVEFVVRDGHLNIGRLVKEPELDNERIARIHPQLQTESWKPKAGESQPLFMEVGTPGMLDTLRFVEDSAHGQDLKPDEVEIEATVWPVSFRDIFIALGRLGNEGFGAECAGIVTRVGSISSQLFRPGDRVVMSISGCMRSHPRAPAHHVVKIPDNLCLNNIVSCISPLMTAYHSLVNLAQLQQGEKVLIHAGAGSTGQMAIAISQRLGAKVFTTVGSDDKKQLLMDTFSIPEDHIFYSRDTSFSQGVKRVAGSVDVVLNSLSGDMLRASWECIAPYGRFIEIGKMDIRANASLPMAFFAKNVTFTAVDLHHISQTSPELARQLLEKSVELITLGDIKPPSPLHLYPVSQAERAIRFMQSGKNTGRTLITISKEDIVPKFLVYKRSWQFDTDASYLIAGGLGGIGRATIRWMVSKGARNLIIPSRSGASSQDARDLVSELSSKNVHMITPCCDVSSAADLLAMLESCVSMPPIKGCINAAMVLQDSIFDNMTHAQWTETIRSKVSTSRNLHNLLPQNIDFFIQLSSLAGIYGSLAQSNYAAGCTFQDLLARSRTAAGYPKSISLNLGWMRTIGIIAENDDYRLHRQQVRDMQPVEEADYLALLEHYCDPDLSPLDVDHSQVLVGAVHPAYFRERGEVPISAVARPLFAGFEASQGEDTHSTELTKQDGTAVLFKQAAGSRKGRCNIVLMAFQTKLARALDVQPEDIDPRRSLADYGVDSLMAVELRNWVRRDFRVLVTVFELMGGTSLVTVGELIVERAG
ncbi:Compactin diketide synthase mlcB [Cladobotryum mycophilum]|uniref:Compactin diketide synthase mlcB n=1 Tax=Cladobotryum mycophilum TaxID=491253 RepID=A0ABR0S8Z1_9HYPO